MNRFTLQSPALPLWATRSAICQRVGSRYFSWDTACTGLATIADQAIVSGTNFCMSVIIARKCAKEELGIYALGMSIVLFTTGLQNSLITMPYLFISPRPGGRIDAQYAGSSLVCALALAFLSAVVLAAWARVGPLQFAPGLSRIVWVLAAVITFILLREYARRVSFAWVQPGAAIAMDLQMSAIQIGGLLLISRMLRLSSTLAYWLSGLACALSALWWFISHRQHFEVRLDRLMSDVRNNWSFGKWIFAGGLIYTARSDLYPWFLASMHGSAATATFATCVSVTTFANPFFIAFSNFLGPKAAHSYANGGIDQLCRVIYKAIFLVTAIMVAFTTVIIAFGNQILVLIYGERYAGGGPIVSILALSLLASVIALGFDAALYAVKDPRATFRANLAGLISTFALGFWAAKYFGPIGAAYGLLAANMIATSSKFLSFSKAMGKLSFEGSPRRFSPGESFGSEAVEVAQTGAER